MTPGLLIPPALAFAAWAAWGIAEAGAEVFAAALVLPLTRPMAAWLVPTALVLGLPWGLFAFGLAFPSVRSGLSRPGLDLVLAWLQVAAVAALAGTFIPGMASVALVPIVVGLAVAAGAALDRAIEGTGSPNSRRLVFTLAILLATVWAVAIMPMGVYVAANLPYYREVAIVAAILGLTGFLAAITAAWERNVARAVGVVLLVAIGLKVAHAGVFVPETNYRFGQGPWGRAVGQWLPPSKSLYVFHPLRTDLAFAVGRPVRLLRDPVFLEPLAREGPQFVLLLTSEYEHWPETAPKLIHVRSFEDDTGRGRVLARTEGTLYRRAPRGALVGVAATQP